MSNSRKLLIFVPLLVFILACKLLTRPLNDVKNIASTAESLATAIPVETLKALPSSIPVETLEALSTSMPDFGNYFNPQGTPVETWKDIPIMPQATAGQEFTDSTTYSFKANVTAKEVQDFYSGTLKDLGWSQPFSLPSQSEGAIMIFQKDNSTLTITVTPSDNSVVVILTLA